MQNIDFDDDEDDMNMEEDAGMIPSYDFKKHKSDFATSVLKSLLAFLKKKLKEGIFKMKQKESTINDITK
jgi:hypothetical protein